jgi:hypothetical protein
MKLKNIYSKLPSFKIGLLFVLYFSMVACKSDYFDKQPLDSISDGTFWKTEKDANLALIGCYNIGAGWSGEDFGMQEPYFILI